MKAVVFAGFSGSGKTTLVEQLIPLLKQQGLRVSVAKHAHHRFDIDQPGKDSWRHRQAGAYEVVIASDLRLALVREFAEPERLSVHALIAELNPGVDWVLVEGFKTSELPKIEVWRAASEQPVQYPEDARIVAIATDSPLPSPSTLPVLDINNPAAVVAWLQQHAALFEYQAPV
ncbi:molybdopterin-guanine dinucleotide biosynthesis protein B [Rhodoferax sp.]|uniref:molybdopterin-guanine dinucleotide biosynthesis protein B n=1 Tax=Rhodoferax sp. TaxID=50421 RepID=UPI0025FD7F11|nr:molybdopterin-guanine dinucleotide biosynthesis protein B [Rhodoferax sp.]